MPHTYKYARPALAVDCVVFGLDEGDLKVALVQRDIEPFKSRWALPGGFVRVEESLDEAALRALREEAGIDKVYLEQLYSFGDLGRDPRERVVTVAYYALVKLGEHPVRAATDTSDARWFPVGALPGLAFDHDRIVRTALTRLQGKLHYEPVGFELLPRKFTLTQLQHLYETVWERELDKRNFRKKILSMDVLVNTGEKLTDVAHRAPFLYRFDERRYRSLKKSGFYFEV